MDVDRSERRAFIRIEYPAEKRPRFIVDDHEMEVINLSERGLKFIDDGQLYGTTGKMVRGKIKFTNEKTVTLSGQIVWTRNNEIGVILNGRIAFSIMKEQESHLLDT
jgi:hypothetical protein